MKVAVIIINFNSSMDSLEAVESVEKSLVPSGFGRKVYVVENGSEAGEWERLQVLAKYPDVELVQSKQNLGFAGGNNLGIKKGREWGANVFLLLNADTKVDRHFLVELFWSFSLERGDPARVGVASPKIYFYPGFEFHKERYAKKDLGKVIWYAGGKVDWDNVVGYHRGVDEVDVGRYDKPLVQDEEVATGCCMLISRAVIDKIGGFDERYFFSWEDTDFSMRAKRAGFKLVFVPKAVIWHKNANTSGGAGSELQDFYQTRNRLIFAFRYASLKVKILLLVTLLRTADWNRLKAMGSALF